MSNSAAPRIGVVADDPLRRLGLVSILEEQVGLNAVPVSLDEAKAEQTLAAVVLDARATGEQLVDSVLRLRRDLPDTKIVVMGHVMEHDFVQEIIGAGAKGYLAETASEGEIRMAMEVVLDGSVWAPRKVLSKLIDARTPQLLAEPVDPVSEKLTRRERDVLKLLMAGRTNRDIAASLDIDEVTVKAHLGRMLHKTGASNRVELTLRAMEEQAQRGR